MAINFPDSPTNGQVATVGGKNYTYNSTKNTWTPTQVTEADLSTVGSTTVVATHDLLPASPSAGDMALVSSVNKMYVYFLSGWWLMSSLQNASPSGITGNAAIYDLAADGTPTTVTLSSSDPEGFPIVWSHSVISGSLGGTTVTNVNNVFTITPSTDAADAGTFTLRFAASDGQGGESGSQSQFTLDFAFIVTNSRYTTLLATADGTSDNNNITDASTNNHSITVNGDAHAGTFSPYRSGGYSGLFDSTSVVQLSFGGSSDFEFGTGNFTIETWFKWNSINKPETTIFSNRISGSTFGTGRYFLKLMPGDTTSGGIEFSFDCGTPRYRLYCVDNLTADDAFFDEGWHHYAAVRNGTSLKLFVDGQEVDEITLPTNETNFGNSSDNIGLGINSSVSSPTGPDGEYRDVRIVKGVAITPPSGGPTETLGAVSGTTFLLYNGEGYVKDKTSNHSPIYGSTAPTITATSPYDYNEYSVTDHGGSIVINSTSAWVQSTVTAPSSGSFAVECWVYWDEFPNTSNGNNQSIISFKGSDNYDGVRLMYQNPSAGGFAVYANDSWFMTPSSTEALQVKTWYHAAITYDGTNLRLFVNGSLQNTEAFSTNLTNADLRIGNDGWWRMGLGKVSDVRYTRGSAVYTTGFTPPTAPLSSSGAELHIKGTDASIIDKSQSANLKLFNNTTGSTTQVKFANTKSMYFDGSGDYIDVSEGFNQLRTSDFTVETWFYPTATPSNHEGIFCYGAHGSGNYLQLLYQTNRLIRYDIYASVGGGSTSNLSTTALSLNTWNHIALCRSDGNIRLYVNGTQEHTEANSSDLNFPKPNNGYDTIAVIGNRTGLSGYELNSAYLQDFRITKGLARYTANFTPPTAPLEG
jgi:hypothetical protein